jgi:hypothetical protein
VCRDGDTNTYCGVNGEACDACEGEEICTDGDCAVPQ